MTPGRWLTNRDVLRVEAATGRTVTVRRLAGRDEAGQPAWSAAVRAAQDLSLRATATWRTRPPRTPPRAAPSTPAMSWSTGSATGRACTWPCPAAGTPTTPTASPAFPAPPTPARAPSPPRNCDRIRRLTPRTRRARAGADRRGAARGSRAAAGCCRGPGRRAAPRRRGLVRDRNPAPRTVQRRPPRRARRRSGTTWSAGPRQSGSRRAARRASPRPTPTPRSATRRAPGCGGRCAKPNAAGLDAGQVLRDAVGAQPLTGARDVARVIDARVRRHARRPGTAAAGLVVGAGARHGATRSCTAT